MPHARARIRAEREPGAAMTDVTEPGLRERAPREPIFNLPGVVLACCVVLFAIQGLRGFASVETDDRLIAQFAFVPARMAIALDLARSQLRTAVQNVPQDTFAALIGSGGGHWYTLVTYALLHGGWAHVGFNCVWLVAFGAPVARRFSAARFLLLLILAAVAGALMQFLWNMASFVPVIGASAAVAGVMGAAVRFVFRPSREPIASLDRSQWDEAFRRPALSLRETFKTTTALVFIILWFATNLLFGLIPSLGGIGQGPIAWQAHVGGFLAGLLLFPLLDAKRPTLSPLDTEDAADLPAEPPP